jgi:BirA family biotin operon repressor/biotin-[acetyl-CoA-carboxylase] ligase
MKKHLHGFKNGDIICAKVQTAGKGRRSNIWMSNSGDLHISVYLDNTTKEDSIFDVILMITNTLVDVFNKYSIDAKIKYPNDIVVGNRKIAGILIERVIGEKDEFVIGIGLNVVTKDFSRIEKKGTSILLETDLKVDYRDVLQDFIIAYNKLIACKSCDLYNAYLDNSVIIGRSVTYKEEAYNVKTINLEGKVVLEKDDKEYAMHMNDISFKEFYDE